MTAPMKFVKSAMSPMRMLSTSATRRSRTRGHSERGTYRRDAAEHFCPWYSKAPRTAAVTSASTSAVGWATMKSLPPVSPTMRG